MKFYDLDTVFSFGKYKGKTVREVIELQPDYISWCIINLEHFIIFKSEILRVKEFNLSFDLITGTFISRWYYTMSKFQIAVILKNPTVIALKALEKLMFDKEYLKNRHGYESFALRKEDVKRDLMKLLYDNAVEASLVIRDFKGDGEFFPTLW